MTVYSRMLDRQVGTPPAAEHTWPDELAVQYSQDHQAKSTILGGVLFSLALLFTTNGVYPSGTPNP